MSGKSSLRLILTEAGETTELRFASYGGSTGSTDYGLGNITFNHDKLWEIWYWWIKNEFW